MLCRGERVCVEMRRALSVSLELRQNRGATRTARDVTEQSETGTFNVWTSDTALLAQQAQRGELAREPQPPIRPLAQRDVGAQAPRRRHAPMWRPRRRSPRWE